jgi:hypothetical protein
MLSTVTLKNHTQQRPCSFEARQAASHFRLKKSTLTDVRAKATVYCKRQARSIAVNKCGQQRCLKLLN